MSLCRFSESFQIFDITPVENLFIQEFMLKAPGDFVKVYLYGLMQCYRPNSTENSLEAFSHALEMDTGTIENAFHYWERQGILYFHKESNGETSVEYFNIKDVLYNKGLDCEKPCTNTRISIRICKRFLIPACSAPRNICVSTIGLRF